MREMTQIMSVGKFGIKNLCIILQATMAAFGCKYGSSMSPITLGLPATRNCDVV